MRHNGKIGAAWLGAFVFFSGLTGWSQQAGPGGSSEWRQTLANPQSTLEQAAQHGVDFQYQCVHDLSVAPAGVPQEQRWFGRYTWTLAASVDLHKTMGWSGTSGFASMKQHVREFGEMDDGVAQGFSNLDTDPHTTLYEIWLQQQLLNGKLTLKAGRMDANADFDAVPTAADFLNSSMGYSPTVMDFPSYPAPQPAVDLTAALGSATRLAAGEFRTPGGRIFLTETDRSWSVGSDAKAGRAALGFWQLREPLTRRDGRSATNTTGLYGVFEQSLWSRSLSSGKSRALSGYLQAGTGDAQVNPYRRHIGSGFVLSAPFAKRQEDTAGAAVTRVLLTSKQRETVVETYYKFTLSKSLSLLMDSQYCRHPGGAGTGGEKAEEGRAKGTWVLTPRLILAF